MRTALVISVVTQTRRRHGDSSSRGQEDRAATNGQLNDGEGLCLRIDDGQGRWWFRYTAPSGQRRAMSLGAAVIRGDRKLIDASLVHAREIAAEARSLLVRGTDPLDIRNGGKSSS